MIPVLAALLAISCSGSKKTPMQQEVTPIVVEKTPKDTIREVTPVKVVEEPKKDTVKGPVIPARTHFNIAVVLPFNTDQVPLNYSPFMVDTSMFLSQETQKALDFYLGLKLAVDDFRKTDVQTNIFILDDGMRPSKVSELLQKRPFPEVDMIIGPGKEFNLPPLLEYASKARVPVISPFVSEVGASNASPWLHAATPSLRTHIAKSADHFHQQFPEKRLVLIWDPTDDSSRMMAEMARAYLTKQYGYSPAMIAFKQGETDAVEGHAWLQESPGFSNAIWVASTRELFVRYLLGKLNGYATQLFIMGTPNWSYMKLSEAGSQYRHVITISDGANLLPSTPAFKAFNERYMADFTREPGVASVLGYDLTTYVLNVFALKRSDELPSSQFMQIQPLQHHFSFEKQPLADGKGAYIHANTQIGFLKWQHPKFVPVK